MHLSGFGPDPDLLAIWPKASGRRIGRGCAAELKGFGAKQSGLSAFQSIYTLFCFRPVHLIFSIQLCKHGDEELAL